MDVVGPGKSAGGRPRKKDRHNTEVRPQTKGYIGKTYQEEDRKRGSRHQGVTRQREKVSWGSGYNGSREGGAKKGGGWDDLKKTMKRPVGAFSRIRTGQYSRRAGRGEEPSTSEASVRPFRLWPTLACGAP